LDNIDEKIINNYQRNLPITENSFDVIADDLQIPIDTLLDRIKNLKEHGVISRIGAVFRPNTIGVSTLAAMAVPKDKITKIAKIINKFTEVNHNYQREHRYNLWFVITADSQTNLNKTIDDIKKKTVHSMLVLPMLKEYHIDLGFDLKHNQAKNINTIQETKKIKLNDVQKISIQAIQQGLPIKKKPFKALAKNFNIDEIVLINTLLELQQLYIIRRFGVIIRHHELGYKHNAMWVLNIQDNKVDGVGKKLAKIENVNLCYLRPRISPDWNYNLFCMVHGKNRQNVINLINKIATDYNLNMQDSQILFSTHRFKQKGAFYIKNSSHK